MTERKNPPFEALSFTVVQDKVGRSALKLTLADDGAYQLHIEKGSAARPQMETNHTLSGERVQKLKDRFDELGVFSWDEHYGDDVAPGSLKWMLSCVFKRDVFSVASRGGSSVPEGFADALEELYQLGLPRPAASGAAGAAGAAGTASAQGSAALGELSRMLGDVSPDDMQAVMADMVKDPEGMRNRLRDEVRSMSPGQREQLIDMLTATGAAPRSFWEQLFNDL